jgi:hypothetical protein
MYVARKLKADRAEAEKEQETKAKTLLIHSVMPRFVGVVCPTNHLYRQWCKDIGSQTYGAYAKFRHIRAIDDIREVEFYAVEKGYRYWEIDQDIYDAAVMRVR